MADVLPPPLAGNKLNEDESRDLVIGCVGNYEWDKVALWANSLRLSGYTGKKVLIVYTGSKAFLDTAAAEGFFLVTFARDAAGNAVNPRDKSVIVVDRFHDMWLLDREPAFKALGFPDCRYLITTDVRDVVFQTNPSAWLSANAKRPIIVGSEAIRYRDEEWGRQNLVASFGRHVYETMKDDVIYNAGTLAGRWSVMKDMFLQIYLMSRNSPHRDPDQSALNILLQSSAYKEFVQYNTLADGWCCNVGTVADPRKPHYESVLVEQGAMVVDEASSTVKNKEGKTFCLLHQYDRNPALNAMVTKKYGG